MSILISALPLLNIEEWNYFLIKIGILRIEEKSINDAKPSPS